MDKNNQKSKIRYKCIKGNTSALWQHRLHIPPTKGLIDLLTTQTKKRQEPHKRAWDQTDSPESEIPPRPPFGANISNCIEF